MKDLTRRQFLQTSIAAPLILTASKSYAGQAWHHIRHWDYQEFQKYSQWVANIYEFKANGTWKQKGARINRVFADDEMNLLNNPDFLENGNPQLTNSQLSSLNAVTHCGSFPKLMWLYYAYRRGLPATVAKIQMKRGGDIRYSLGNHPVRQVRSMPFDGDFREFINDAIAGGDGGYNFVSGNFRTAPFLEETDSVPIAIDRKFLMPGSMCYNANGHCLLVGKLDDSGEVHFLDSHPDHSITFNQTLSAVHYVARPTDEKGFSLCYDGFRNFRLAKIVDGRAVPFTNQEMIEFGFSIEQYEIMSELSQERENGGIEVRGKKVMHYPQFVRARLQRGIEDPLSFLELSTQELGQMFRERAAFVQEAWEDVLAYGPITFPNDSPLENIYQAHGRWETWSSPSSDTDRKQKYNYIATRLEEIIEGYPNARQYDYRNFDSREQLIKTLLERKNTLFSQQIVHYTTSNGQDIGLTLLDIEQRLFELSFDPNHPPELRWGAPPNSYERYKMRLFKTPLRVGRSLDALEAYELERGLRYYPLRQTTPTSLNPEDNPKKPPFELIDVRLKSLIR